MGRMLVLTFVSLLILFTGLVSAAELPAYQEKYVNDFASVLTSGEQQELRTLFIDIEKETSAEVTFVSVATTGDRTPQQYASALLSAWGVGKKGKDNGLVLLYAAAEKKFWVATGYGIEGILPDSKIGRLLDENYVPLRDQGNVSQGIVQFAHAAGQVIIDNKDEVLAGTTGASSNFSLEILIFLFFLAVIGLLIFFKKFAGTVITSYTDPVSQQKESGIKKDRGYQTIVFFGSIILAFIFFIYDLLLLGVLVLILGPALFRFLRGIRCAKDGARMKYVGKSGAYKQYRCPHGHMGKMLVAAALGYYLGSGRSSSGFGGGGFGGGGFGGGGGGGGGGGR